MEVDEAVTAAMAADEEAMVVEEEDLVERLHKLHRSRISPMKSAMR